MQPAGKDWPGLGTGLRHRPQEQASQGGGAGELGGPPLHTLNLTTWTRGAPAWQVRHDIHHNIFPNYSEKISPHTVEKTAKQLFNPEIVVKFMR